MTEKYGFMVRKDSKGWWVALPHQCDEWVIEVTIEDTP